MLVESPSLPPVDAALDRDAPRDPHEALHRRALELWPRLEHRILTRCGGDTRRIAMYVSHRTCLSVEAIQALLERRPEEDEGSLWFG